MKNAGRLKRILSYIASDKVLGAATDLMTDQSLKLGKIGFFFYFCLSNKVLKTVPHSFSKTFSRMTFSRNPLPRKFVSRKIIFPNGSYPKNFFPNTSPPESKYKLFLYLSKWVIWRSTHCFFGSSLSVFLVPATSAANSSWFGACSCRDCDGPFNTITSWFELGTVVIALALHSLVRTRRQSQYTLFLCWRDRR